MNTQDLILQNLILNEDYLRKTISFIDESYFNDVVCKGIFQKIKAYFIEKNSIPHQNILLTDIVDSKHLDDAEIVEAQDKIKEIYKSSNTIDDLKWLMDETEKWCVDQRVYNAIKKTIAIYDGTDKNSLKSSIPDLLKDAISFSFETDIGKDWESDAENRYDRYHYLEGKIPFDLETLNDITVGGAARKTLNLLIAGVHVGKTMTLVHLAAGYVKLGYNVLYFSLEMDEDQILLRVDANMLKNKIKTVQNLSKESYLKRIEKIKNKGIGKLKVIQFPTSSASVQHFKHTISELETKQGWKPDVVIIDYIGITASSKLKPGSTNSYFYLKSVAEEIRAMAIELDVLIWSASQVNRAAQSSTSIGIEDIAESMGLSQASDLMLALHRTEEMDKLNQIGCKQLKNRYQNMSYRSKFVLGCDYEMQLLSDIDEKDQNLIQDIVDVNQDTLKSKVGKGLRNKTFEDFEF